MNVSFLAGFPETDFNGAVREWPVVAGTVTSGGYNVVDVALGTAGAGWEAAATDKTFATLGISDVPFDTTTFAPVAGLGSVVPSLSVDDFPATDFYGAARTWPGAARAVK